MAHEQLPLPRSTAELVEKTDLSLRHPGLQLDKFTRPSANQEAQKTALEEVCRTEGDAALLQDLLQRRSRWLAALSARVRRCVTAGPLTLHLARASALENAGLCLHPVYGFPYLLGSGLKGMARAFAETVWLPTQPDKDQAKERVKDVFGHEPDRSGRVPGHAGAVVFHDAWPEKWPRLVVDVTNNHHQDYYAGKDAPGDWEAPAPVYFLAVNSGAIFSFALSKRHPDVDDELVDLAWEWLHGALVHLGAGAKTAAGYGTIHAVEGTESISVAPSPSLAVWDTSVELVTPAFLAGARQEEEDCQLRAATLKGLLRWWWRTMHAGFVNVDTLRALEAAIWGDTKVGSAVRVTVEPEREVRCSLYNFKDRGRPKEDFRRAHQLQEPPDRKTTQGLFYASYGMDDGGKRRHFIESGSKWKINLTARGSKFEEKLLSPEKVLDQAQAALWLLCCFGGVGSKSRKGFGSLEIRGAPGGDCRVIIDKCREIASILRRQCGLGDEFCEEWAESPSLESMLPVLEISTEWRDPWFTLDQLGYAIQSFAKRKAHEKEKCALGLPRKIHGPREEPMRNQDPRRHCRPEVLTAPKGDRHASPILCRVGREEDGRLLIRVAAFPARYLPDPDTSRRVLEEFIGHFQREVNQRARTVRGPTGSVKKFERAPVRSVGASQGLPQAGSRLPRPGDRVEAVLLAEKTKKGGWRARHEPTGLSGPIQNSGQIPISKAPGDRVTLIVVSVSRREMAFRWPEEK